MIFFSNTTKKQNLNCIPICKRSSFKGAFIRRSEKMEWKGGKEEKGKGKGEINKSIGRRRGKRQKKVKFFTLGLGMDFNFYIILYTPLVYNNF